MDHTWLMDMVRVRIADRTSYHLSTPICHIFTPSARPAHDASGWHHSTCDDATWPSGYAVVDRQYCVWPGHAAVPSPATPHTRCGSARRIAWRLGPCDTAPGASGGYNRAVLPPLGVCHFAS